MLNSCIDAAIAKQQYEGLNLALEELLVLQPHREELHQLLAEIPSSKSVARDELQCMSRQRLKEIDAQLGNLSSVQEAINRIQSIETLDSLCDEIEDAKTFEWNLDSYDDLDGPDLREFDVTPTLEQLSDWLRKNLHDRERMRLLSRYDTVVATTTSQFFSSWGKRLIKDRGGLTSTELIAVANAYERATPSEDPTGVGCFAYLCGFLTMVMAFNAIANPDAALISLALTIPFGFATAGLWLAEIEIKNKQKLQKAWFKRQVHQRLCETFPINSDDRLKEYWWDLRNLKLPSRLRREE